MFHMLHTPRIKTKYLSRFRVVLRRRVDGITNNDTFDENMIIIFLLRRGILSHGYQKQVES